MSRRFWSQLTQQLEPYTPGEQPRMANLLKLNTNESPYPPSAQVLAAIREVTAEELPRYPDPSSAVLRDVIARHHSLEPSQVFLGNGSDEVLSHVFLGLLKQQRELLFPDISYSFYPVWCQLHGVHYRQVPLRDDFSLAAEDYDIHAAAVILPNPNAPTGRLLARAEIRAFLSAAPNRLLVVDEAYIDFGGESAVSLIDAHDNLLVVQTLSKSRALAGLRIGLAMGSEDLIEGLNRVKDSFNSYPIDLVAQRAAAASYNDIDWFRSCCDRVIESREYLREALLALDFEVVPSAANFLFVKHRTRPGKMLFDALRAQGIIVRRWDRPRIGEYLRISVGTREQCERLVLAMESLVVDSPLSTVTATAHGLAPARA